MAEPGGAKAYRIGHAAAWSRFANWLGPVALTLFILRLLTPGLGGIVTNDSLGYLSRSVHPFKYGFVVQGYRQAAYPVGIHFLAWLAPVGIDRVFAVALAQRLLLVMGVVLIWNAMRWWAAPLLVAVTSATFVLHTNYVLMEGFLVPASLIVGALAASMATGSGAAARHPRITMVAITAAATSMGAVKLQYSAAIMLAGAVAWIAVRDQALSLRFALISLALGATVISGIVIGQTFQNHRNLGTWEPVGERARAEWYGAWVAVFSVHPANRSKPALAEYFAHGNLYTFMHGLEATQPNYKIRQAEMRDRVAEMFAAAHTTRLRQEVAAFLGGLEGGRTDDIGGITSAVLAAGSNGGDVGLDANSIGSSGGPSAVNRAVNQGHDTEFVTIGGVTGPLQNVAEDYRPERPTIGVACLILALLGCLVPGRHRPIVLASVLAVLAVCAALATAYIDNARYLVGPMALSLVAGTLGLRALALGLPQRKKQPDDVQ